MDPDHGGGAGAAGHRGEPMKVLLLIGVIVLAGCAKPEKIVTLPPAIEVFQPVEVRFETLADYGGLDEGGILVIRDAEGWKELRFEIKHGNLLKPSLPDISFDRKMVIAAFQGKKPTAGYRIEVTKVVEMETHLEIFVRETAPGPRCYNASVPNSPAHIIGLRRIDKEVWFNRENKVVTCE